MPLAARLWGSCGLKCTEAIRTTSLPLEGSTKGKTCSCGDRRKGRSLHQQQRSKGGIGLPLPGAPGPWPDACISPRQPRRAPAQLTLGKLFFEAQATPKSSNRSSEAGWGFPAPATAKPLRRGAGGFSRGGAAGAPPLQGAAALALALPAWEDEEPAAARAENAQDARTKTREARAHA